MGALRSCMGRTAMRAGRLINREPRYLGDGQMEAKLTTSEGRRADERQRDWSGRDRPGVGVGRQCYDADRRGAPSAVVGW
jgi:hypothetical protein